MNMNKSHDMNILFKFEGLEELSKKLDEMNEHIKKAISIAEEIAENKIEVTSSVVNN